MGAFQNDSTVLLKLWFCKFSYMCMELDNMSETINKDHMLNHLSYPLQTSWWSNTAIYNSSYYKDEHFIPLGIVLHKLGNVSP